MQGQEAPLFKTNLDTNFLKLIAVVTMIIDHVGTEFYPDEIGWRLIGRLAFPLFCYCMTVGMLYTRDIKRYVFRVGLFAILSQPFYVFAFNQNDFWGNLTNWNIFFTLFFSLIGIWGFYKKGWGLLLFALMILVLSFWNFDYNITGLIYMLIFYCCRRCPKLGFWIILVVMLLPSVTANLWGGAYFTIGSVGFNMGVTTIFALPFIYLHTNVHPKVNKYFFYGIYPLHLGIIGLVRLLIGPRA